MDFSNFPLHYWLLMIGVIIVCNISYFKKIRNATGKNKLKGISDQELLTMETLLKEVREEETLALLKTYLDRLMEGKVEMIPVYGYRFTNGVLTKTIYNYMFGFNPGMDGFLLVSIDSKGVPVNDPVRFDKSNVTSLKYMLDGSLQIKSPDLESGSVAVIIPGFTLDDHQDMYMLTVNQVVTTTAFKKYLKRTFNF